MALSLSFLKRFSLKAIGKLSFSNYQKLLYDGGLLRIKKSTHLKNPTILTQRHNNFISYSLTDVKSSRSGILISIKSLFLKSSTSLDSNSNLNVTLI